jgi:hypothetical protein
MKKCELFLWSSFAGERKTSGVDQTWQRKLEIDVIGKVSELVRIRESQVTDFGSNRKRGA